MNKKKRTPTLEEFKKEINAVFSEGDPVEAYNRVLYYIENGTTTDGKPITWDIIFTKYKEHIALWNFKYGAKERDNNGRYFSETMRKERKTIFDFCGAEMFNWDFIIPKGSPERNKYLFGPFSQTSLSNSRTAFQERLREIDYGKD